MSEYDFSSPAGDGRRSGPDSTGKLTQGITTTNDALFRLDFGSSSQPGRELGGNFMYGWMLDREGGALSCMFFFCLVSPFHVGIFVLFLLLSGLVPFSFYSSDPGVC